MAKKKTTKKSKAKSYTYVGKVYVCSQEKINIKNISTWLSENATLDLDFESAGSPFPADVGVGISIDWGSLKLAAKAH